MARELLPARYPYPYEFEEALRADPGNPNLRREYAFLLLAMARNAEARRQLEIQVREHPDDRVSSDQLRLLKEPAKPPDQPSSALVATRPAGPPPDTISAKEMGIRATIAATCRTPCATCRPPGSRNRVTPRWLCSWLDAEPAAA